MKEYDKLAVEGLLWEWRLGRVFVSLHTYSMWAWINLPPIRQVNLGHLCISYVSDRL